MELGLSEKPNTQTQLYVNLFGVFNYLDRERKLFSFKSRKTAAVLLALCLVGPRGIRREDLAFLLWPDLTEARAKAGLRRALSRIRAISASSLYKPSSGWVAINEKVVSCDLWVIQQAIEGKSRISQSLLCPTEGFLVSFPNPTDTFSEWVTAKIDSNKNTLKMRLFAVLNGESSAKLDKQLAAQFLLLIFPIDPIVNDRVLSFLRHNNDIKLFESVFEAFERRSYARGKSSKLNQLSKKNRTFLEKLSSIQSSRPSKSPIYPSRRKNESQHHIKPILVVESFKFLGTYADVKYLGEAISEELIQRLSKQNWFSVQYLGLPNSYKPKGVKNHALNKLCNNYNLSGTVLADENTIRISVRLSDSDSGFVYWSAQYDDEMKNILSVHTEIVGKISEILSSKLISVEAKNISENAISDDSELTLDVWENTMRARNLFWRTSRINNQKAKALLEPVIKTEFPPIPALVTAAFTRLVDTWSLWSEKPIDDIEYARRIAERAVQLDPSDPWSYFTLGTCLGAAGNLKSAIYSFDRSLELNPNFSASIGARGKYKIFNGNIEEGEKDLIVALEMNDLDPHYGLWQQAYGIAKFLQGDFDEALFWCERAISTNSYWYHNYILSAAILSMQGNLQLGHKEYAKVLKFLPKINSTNWFYGDPFKNQKDKRKFVEALSVYGFK